MENKETYWSKFANDFEEKNNYVAGKDNIIKIMDKILEQGKLKTCLELGCGNGTYSKVLSTSSEQVTATDFSDEMVAESTKRLKNYSNISVQKANCFDLQFEDSSYDTAFMANLLHIIPSPEKTLTETKRVLKPGGNIIIVSFTTQGMTFKNKLVMIYRYLKTYGKPSPYANKLTLDEVQKMLSNQNFEIIEADLIGDTMKALFIKAKKRVK